ncbi:MAG: hypothetical protein M3365_06415, partial [Gemmatimonadota bacterium]|nr:hypothetical protein [Gemmatimonadota bacterium]
MSITVLPDPARGGTTPTRLDMTLEYPMVATLAHTPEALLVSSGGGIRNPMGLGLRREGSTLATVSGGPFLDELRDTGDLSQLITHRLFDSVPVAFTGRAELWRAWKAELGVRLEVDPYSVLLVGSAA